MQWTIVLSLFQFNRTANVSLLIIMLCCWWRIIKLNPPRLFYLFRWRWVAHSFSFRLQNDLSFCMTTSVVFSLSSSRVQTPVRIIVTRNRLSLYPIFHLSSQPREISPTKMLSLKEVPSVPCLNNKESCCFPWHWANNLQELLLYKRSPVNVALFNIVLLLYCVLPGCRSTIPFACPCILRLAWIGWQIWDI